MMVGNSACDNGGIDCNGKSNGGVVVMVIA